jgi:primosomal protein N'
MLRPRALQWPPFVRLVFAGVMGRDRREVESAIEQYAEFLRGDERWDVLGPAAYPLARLNDEWRYRIAIKTKDLDAVRDALRTRVLPVAAKAKTTRVVITFEA